MNTYQKPIIGDFLCPKTRRLNIPKYRSELSRYQRESRDFSFKAMSKTEIDVEQYFESWLHKFNDSGDYVPLDEEDVINFYLELLPLTDHMDKKCPEWYIDYGAYVSHYYDKSNRTMTAAYTPWGIRGLDGYFCVRIRNCIDLEDAYRIERQIVGCHHLHLKIRENLLLNLNTTMERL